MAETVEPGRLLPSILDRLTDDEPENRTKDSVGRRGQSLRALRQSVQRDLEWLLNTGNLASAADLDAYPLVAESVLNYGIPDLAGSTSSGVDATSVEQALRKAILDFEPRLLRNTLKVRLYVDPDDMGHNAMRFDIEGQLWAEPIPEPIFLKTELDLESGSVVVSEQTGAR